ncbi:MAG: protein translocase subunit SecF [Desulfurellaceae bacterium]|nr:protein translocase subunit SecF [Desulfurellaceae bacterium]
MELIRPGTDIDFLRYSKIAAVFSSLLVLIGLATFFVRGGLTYGVDFAGGTIVHVKFSDPPTIAEVRQVLSATDIQDLSVQDFGLSGDEFLIRMAEPETDIGTDEDQTSPSVQVQDTLKDYFGERLLPVQRVETVGPKVGRNLRTRGILSVLFAALVMGTYIAFRFQLSFGIGAAVALFHDVLITATALLLMDVEFDLPIVAAFLTVIGYSVNDTVVVCDRIRENQRKMRRETLATIIQRSINEMLSRTLITSGTTLMVLLALYFLGGSVINGFAFVLLVGFTIGTYSSIYVASPIVLLWSGEGRRR